MRWSAEEIEPWDRKGEKVEDKVVHQRGGGMERMPEEMQQQEKRTVANELNMPKSFNTKRENYEEYGYTKRCPGCRALLTSTTMQKHTTQCKSRMEEEMGNDESVKGQSHGPRRPRGG